jgi:hypothetical protein
VARNLDFIEYYLKVDRAPLRNNLIDACYDGLKNKLSNSGDYWNISMGIMHTIRLMVEVETFIEEAGKRDLPQDHGSADLPGASGFSRPCQAPENFRF